jgi:transglutaminase-like putative cysteine protease/uncharacterized membrane protein YgcG
MSVTHKLRHPLRILALGAAVYCAAGALTGTAGSIAAVVGTALGVVLGEILGRRRLRLWIVAIAAIALAVVGVWLGSAATKYEFIPDTVGPSAALRLSAILRFGVVAFAVVTAVRAAARRIPTFAAIELVAAAGAFAIPFAAHRDGVMIRPLWLSDWAWHNGIDPSVILLVIGASVAGTLALLMMFESERRPSVVSFLALPGIAAIAAIVFAVAPAKPTRTPSEVAISQQPKGDPPLPNDKTGSGQGAGRQPQGSGTGGQQPQGSGSGGGQPQQGSGSGGGQSQQPPSDWQEPQEGPSKSSPMAVVLLGDDYTPPIQAYYFRQEAWSAFSGARLVTPRSRDVDLDLPREQSSGTLPPPPGTDSSTTQLLHADVALLVTHKRSFFLGAPIMWQALQNPDPSKFVRVYRFESIVQTVELDKLAGRTGGDPAWSPELRDYYLATPADPRFGELSDKIVAAIPEPVRDDPFVRAAAIKQYLDKTSIYSLKGRHAGVPDPTADFLFGDHIGYCVHLAHAAVFLWREAGIPSRIGVGYRVEEDNRRGSTLMIRGGDAHAWPELYLDGVGWTILDISAAKNLDPPGTPPDDDLQLQLAELARGSPPDPFTGETLEQRTGASFVAPAAIALGAFLAAALLVLYSIKSWRRLAPRFASPGALPRVGYRAALDLLAETGRARAVGETREKFASRLEADAPAFVKLTDMHLAARLGPPEAPRQSRSEWRTLLAGLRRELAKTAPLGRRILALLNPISFRASR